MGKIVEGVWDCKYCGSARIRGSAKQCPACGKPRGVDAKYYMAEINYVSDEEAARISRNPDWYCGYCDTLNSDEAKFCVSCGASREESEKNYFELQAEKERKEAERQKFKNPEPAPAKGGGGLRRLFPILAAVAAIFLFMSFLPKSKNVSIVSKDWQTVTDVEVFKAVQENDWSLPEGAYDVSQKTEIRSYNRVLDHYEKRERTYYEKVLDHYDTEVSYRDMGNGYFEEEEHQVPVYVDVERTEIYDEPIYRQEPVYDTKYYYTIDKWVLDHEERLSGSGDEVRYYSERLSGNLRTGDTSAEYTVTLLEKDKEKTYPVAEDVWMSMKVGEEYTVKVKSGRIIEATPS